jgi:hypothetical protein
VTIEEKPILGTFVAFSGSVWMTGPSAAAAAANASAAERLAISRMGNLVMVFSLSIASIDRHLLADPVDAGW